ncbi:MAG: hypothetical protein V3S24_22665, partial [Candidatus Tectomicrobia bacterium]
MSLPLEELAGFRYGDFEIGNLCVPSVRWILRRHDLNSVAAARQVLAAYVTSAIGLAQEMERLLEVQQPRALVVFNGTFFPEATARAVALAHDIPVITYEIGFRPLSAFFSHDVATE